MPIIYGKRIRFRAAEQTDIDRFLSWVNDPEVTENLENYLPLSSYEEEKWYESMMSLPGQNHVMVIEIRKTSDGITRSDEWIAIGNTQFISIDERVRSAEVGIMIGEKDHWDNGYGTEAMELMLAHGFKTLNLNRIWLRVYQKNLRGIRTYEKAGFIKEGVLREAHYQHGSYSDVLIMSVLRKEWQSE